MKKNSINIMIPIDFNKNGENGIKTAVLVSKKVMGTLHLVHIVLPFL